MYAPSGYALYGGGPGVQNAKYDNSGKYLYDEILKNLVAPVIAEGTKMSRSMNTRLAEIVNALDGVGGGVQVNGMVNDGVIVGGNTINGTMGGTDNGPLFQALINYCGANGKTLYIPPGIYYFDDAGGSGISRFYAQLSSGKYMITATPGTVKFLLGDNFDQSYGRVFFQAVLSGTSVNHYEFFYIHGITFQGRWSQLNLAGWNGGHYRSVSEISNFARVHWDTCQFYDIRGAWASGNNAYCNSAIANDNVYHRIARGNIDRFFDSNRLFFLNNDCRWIDDNPSASVSFQGHPVMKQQVLLGNHYEQSDGLNFLGGKSRIVANNTFDAMRGAAISFLPNGSTSGLNTAESNVIFGNSIKNTTTGVAAGAAILGNAYQGLAKADPGSSADINFGSQPLSNATTGGGAGADYPGWPNAAGTAIVDPIGQDTNLANIVPDNWGAGDSIAEDFANIIGFNTITRTFGPQTAYSNIKLQPGNGGEGAAGNGFCKLFSFDGWIDPVVLNDAWGAGNFTNFCLNGIRILNPTRNLAVVHNQISSKRRGFAITFDTSTAADENRALRDILIGWNNLMDNRFAVATSRYLQGTVKNWDVDFIGNMVNGDPFYIQPERNGVGGAWTVQASNYNQAGGFLLTGWQGGRFWHNKIKNAYDPLIGTASVINDYFNIRDNYLHAKPNATGYDAGNLGLAVIHVAGPRFHYEIRDPNVGSATFGQMLNQCLTSSATMPAAGYYVRGEFVQYTGTDFPALLGWSRLTTGNAHVLGVDWQLRWSGPQLNLYVNNLTLAGVDAGNIVSVNNAAGRAATIPANATLAFPVGTSILLVQRGAGAVTATPAGGVTLTGAVAVTAGVGQSILIYKEDTDAWVATITG